MKYFVLKPKAKTKDDTFVRASQQAMYAYAKSIWQTNNELSKSIEIWAMEEECRQTNMSFPLD